MNMRQKKKFEKKLGCKKYIDYRNIMIAKRCAEYAKEHQIEYYAIYVIDSRKMNSKHPVKCTDTTCKSATWISIIWLVMI